MDKVVRHQPLLIIAFARPDGVRRILEIAIESGVSRIYISMDGPRDKIDSDRIAQIQRVVSEFKSDSGIEIFTNELTTNHGVAAGVIHAIDWFYSKVESGIILEDDIMPTNSFFEFCETALALYAKDQRIKMISGTQVFPDEKDKRSIRVANYPMIWGWATWAEDWNELRSHFFEVKPLRISSVFDYRWQYWFTGARRAISGLVDTWDTPIAFQFYNRGLLAITPPINLVTNIGADDVAVHTSIDAFPLNLPRFEAEVSSFVFPPSIELESIKYSQKLERDLFQIRYRHCLSPLVSILFDFWRFRHSKRRDPLKIRI